MGTWCFCAKATNTGCSSRQATHHVAQTLKIHTLPRMSAGENCSPTVSVGKLKSGAALLMSGEGISRGSRFKPTAKNTTKPKNKNKGMRNFFMASTLVQRWLSLFFVTLEASTVATVQSRQHTTQHHQQHATPQPRHKGFVVNTHAPFGARVIQRFAQ